MNKNDLVFLIILGLVIYLFTCPGARALSGANNPAQAYLMGFLKFSILSTMGEFLALRIAKHKWVKLSGLFLRMLLWGFLGTCIVLVFELFHSGVGGAIAKGLLPGKNSNFLPAFFTSSLMNILFAPTMMAFHRIADAYIDLIAKRNASDKNLKRVINTIDWGDYISIVVLKTIPFFWIPAHTIVFLLPDEFRVIAAALLSIVLGVILALSSETEKKRYDRGEFIQ